MIVKFDHENKTARLSLRAQEILAQLQKAEIANPEYVLAIILKIIVLLELEPYFFMISVL